MIAANAGQCKVTAMMIQPRGTEGAAVYTVFWNVSGRGEIHRQTTGTEFWGMLLNMPEPDYSERNYWAWQMEAGQ